MENGFEGAGEMRREGRPVRGYCRQQMMVVWDSRAGEKLLDLGNVLRCSGEEWLMDRMGGSEGKGRKHGRLLTAGSSTHAVVILYRK